MPGGRRTLTTAKPAAAAAVAPPDAGAVAVAAGIAQRLPDGSVVFHSPSHRPPVRRPAPAPPPPLAANVDDTAEPMVQRTEAEPETSTPAITTTTAATTAAEATPTAVGSEAEGDELAELVKKMWPEIRWRLRTELRVDRERKGQR
jgi:hypothetical protein